MNCLKTVWLRKKRLRTDTGPENRNAGPVRVNIIMRREWMVKGTMGSHWGEIFQLDWLHIERHRVDEMTLALSWFPQWTRHDYSQRGNWLAGRKKKENPQRYVECASVWERGKESERASDIKWKTERKWRRWGERERVRKRESETDGKLNEWTDKDVTKRYRWKRFECFVLIAINCEIVF